jgi:hypothetical protein
MLAFLSAQSPAITGVAEVLQYTPPAGSTLVGGKALVGLSADGYGYRAVATAAMFTPAYQYDATNVFLQCVAVLAACQNGLANYYGVVDLPPDRGGNLYLHAGCQGQVAGTYCSQGANRGAWSIAGVGWANLSLSTSAAPTASGFAGTLLDPAAHGTAGLSFTAADGGPGVYKVTVAIDGTSVYDATPNTNAGKCVPVATDTATGALMWAWQQPCPQSQGVDVQVRTTPLSDGPHELTVTVVNPALDASTVLRRTITTNNRTTVSSTLTSDKPAPAAAGSPPAPALTYAVVLDPPTQAIVGGVKAGWSRSALTLSGTLQHSAGVPAQGVLMTLFARHAGQDAPQPVARATTDAAGHWVLAAPRGPSRVLAIVSGEQPDPASAQAIKIRQTVKPNITLRVQPLGGGRLRFSGRLKIAPLGSPRPLVVIQTRNHAKRWQAVGTDLRVSASGAYSIIYDGGSNVVGGSYSFRTVAHATSMFATGVSRIKRARVR